MKMATIVFMPFHWASDLNPTFALARKLRNRGHHIDYFGIPDIAGSSVQHKLIPEDHADPATHVACAGMN
jgi:UDP:flavonoid glycosyltransferase YjiC (YdhE family)